MSVHKKSASWVPTEVGEKQRTEEKKNNGEKRRKLGYPELCHNRLDCFVSNLVGVEQN